MVEVFKTNITQAAVAEKVTTELSRMLPLAKINFDLEDCDHILRIELNANEPFPQIQQHLQQAGFVCEVLE
ncbi:MAG: hypothetical protein JNM57_12640 [Cyclobacteriaceae bacterium]|nr:hypothetical protein [Cyclobacteriaceae bacterium]